MTSHEPPEDVSPRQGEEDTEAILSRRRFLISSTLAGAGIGAALSGCRTEPPEPKVCLTPLPPKQPPEPKACLSIKKIETPKPEP